MNFNERKEIIQFFNKIEADFETESWIYRDVKVWPILKTYFFLKIFWNSQIQSHHRIQRKGIRQAFKSFVKRKIIGLTIDKLELDQIEFLFFSGGNFRETIQESSLNKFYDPIGNYLEENQKSFKFFEYGHISNHNIYKERGINIQYLYSYFEGESRQENIDFSKWNGFVEFEDFVSTKLSCTKNSLKFEVLETLKKVNVWSMCFEWILSKTKPKKIFLLSYYNLPCFGLLIAAKKRGISCIDIQHGTQGNMHPAYSGFKQNYSLLPDVFWLWDQKTESQLIENFKFSNFKTLVGGNPWHYYLSNLVQKLSKTKASILYTLQPIHPLIDDYVLEVMEETKEEFDWFVRLHPRINAEQVHQLISELKLLGIYNENLWKLANESPLPSLLKDVDLHISKFSGCISEAADLGTFSIILEKNGEIAYRHLIESEIAAGGIDSDSRRLLSAIQENIGKRKQVESIDLKTVLDNFC